MLNNGFKVNIFQTNFIFSGGYNYYASARMIASQLNQQIISVPIKRPLTHYWSSPLNVFVKEMFGVFFVFFFGGGITLECWDKFFYY